MKLFSTRGIPIDNQNCYAKHSSTKSQWNISTILWQAYIQIFPKICQLFEEEGNENEGKSGEVKWYYVISHTAMFIIDGSLFERFVVFSREAFLCFLCDFSKKTFLYRPLLT